MLRFSCLRAPSIAAAAAAFVLSSAPRGAEACGGFFCSRTPVDQTAEHILFTINPDVTVSAYVQISYAGDKDNFAWIVPVPGVPKLATDFPELAFQALDVATQPQYFKNVCFAPEFAAPGAGGARSADAGAVANNGVNVISRQVVGPYDTTTLEGTSADLIVQWLQTNGYRITDKMIPVLAPYVADGMKFVALRLTPQAGVSDVKPLTMTYPGNQPWIPIRLTAVAAQPEMGIVAWVLGDKRYAPDNYQDLKIADSLITFDQYGNQNNYLTVVSKEADKVGGEAFVTEYVQPTTALLQQLDSQPVPPPSVNPDAQPARDALVGLLQQFPRITRLYTRISAEEMLDDPRFKVAIDQSDVSNVHDLTDPNFSYSTCNQEPPPDPCAFNYCGREGACTTITQTVNNPGGTPYTTSTVACVCKDGTTARPTSTNNGQVAIYCEPLSVNFDADATGSAATTVPACEGFDCGAHGECVSMNNNPTCRCEAGYGATVQNAYDATSGTYKTQVTCQPTFGKALVFPRVPDPGQTTMPMDSSSSDSGSCTVARLPRTGRASGLAWIAAGLAVAAGTRRRRANRRR
jgi:hypothetical protein